MKLKPDLGASCAIRPGNGVGLFYSSWTHTGPMNYKKYTNTASDATKSNISSKISTVM